MIFCCLCSGSDIAAGCFDEEMMLRSVSELCVETQGTLGGYVRNRYSLWMGLENRAVRQWVDLSIKNYNLVLNESNYWPTPCGLWQCDAE